MRVSVTCMLYIRMDEPCLVLNTSEKGFDRHVQQRSAGSASRPRSSALFCTIKIHGNKHDNTELLGSVEQSNKPVVHPPIAATK